MGMAAPQETPTGPPEPPLKQEPVSLALLVQKTTSDAYASLQSLCKSLPGRGEWERKLALLKYLVKTRQRLLRLHVLTEWAKTQAPLIMRGQQLAGTLEWHDTSLRDAADQLFFLHAQLRQARAPVYDVPTALEVLTTGTYSRLPTVIQDLRPPAPPPPSELASALSRADRAIRARLLQCELPPQLSDVHVADGAVRMRVEDEFEVRLTLGAQGDLSKWRILWLVLVGEGKELERDENDLSRVSDGTEGVSSGVKEVNGGGLRGLTEGQRLALAAEIERRMGLASEPLQELYRVLHELVANLVLDSVFRQAHALKQGTWRDVIRLHFEKSDAESVYKSLRIEYWDRHGPAPGFQTGSVNRLQTGSVSLEPVRPSPSSHSTPQPDHREESPLEGGVSWALKGPPSLRVELDEEGHVSASHWPVVVDPDTEESALFSVADHGANLEKLLGKAVRCSAHSRLLELEERVRREPLLDCVRSCLAWDRAFGSFDEGGSISGAKDGGVEKLWVRVYGNVGVGVEVNARTGRFHLRQPGGLFAAARLRQLEERLNNAAEAPGPIFLDVRKAALMRMFQSMAAAAELEPYTEGVASLDIPPESGPSLLPDSLLCAFPGVLDGVSFFLATSFDSFCIPVFTLLAASNPENAVGGPVNGTVSGTQRNPTRNEPASIRGTIGGSGTGSGSISAPVSGSFGARPRVIKWMTVGVKDRVIEETESAASLLGWGTEAERAAAIAEEEDLRKRLESGSKDAEAEKRVLSGLGTVSLGVFGSEPSAGSRERSRGMSRGTRSKEQSLDPLSLLKEWPEAEGLGGDWPDASGGLGNLLGREGSFSLAERPPSKEKGFLVGSGGSLSLEERPPSGGKDGSNAGGLNVPETSEGNAPEATGVNALGETGVTAPGKPGMNAPKPTGVSAPETTGVNEPGASSVNASGVTGVTDPEVGPSVRMRPNASENASVNASRFERSVTMDMVDGLLEMLGEEEAGKRTGVGSGLGESLQVWEGSTGVKGTGVLQRLDTEDGVTEKEGLVGVGGTEGVTERDALGGVEAKEGGEKGDEIEVGQDSETNDGVKEIEGVGFMGQLPMDNESLVGGGGSVLLEEQSPSGGKEISAAVKERNGEGVIGQTESKDGVKDGTELSGTKRRREDDANDENEVSISGGKVEPPATSSEGGVNEKDSEEPAAKKQRVESEPDLESGLESGDPVTQMETEAEGASGADTVEDPIEAEEILEDSILGFDPNTAVVAEPQDGEATRDVAALPGPLTPKSLTPKTLSHAPDPSDAKRCRLAVGRRFSSLLAAANQGRAPCGVYQAAFYAALAHCRQFIKHDVIKSQLTSADVAFAEEVGLRRPSFDLKVKVTGLDGGDDVAPAWPSIRVVMGGLGAPGVAIRVEDEYLGALAGRQRKSDLERGNRKSDTVKTEEGTDGASEDALAAGGVQKGGSKPAENTPPKDWLSRNGIVFLEGSPEDAHMRCDQRGLEIRVSRITPTFAADLVAELKRIWLARAFVLHLAEALGVLSGVDELEQLAGRREKWAGFRITGVGLTDVEVCFEGFRTVLMSVSWPRTSEGARVSLLPVGVEALEPHFEEFVNEGEVGLLLDAVRIAAVPQGLLAEALPSARITRRVMYAPSEVQLQVMSPYKARVTFRSCFTLEMRFFAGDYVWLQPVPPPDPSNPRGYAQIPGFQWFVSEQLAAARAAIKEGVPPGVILQAGTGPTFHHQGSLHETSQMSGDSSLQRGGSARETARENEEETLGVLETPREKLARFRSFGSGGNGSGVLASFPSFARQGSGGRAESDVLISPGVGPSALNDPPQLITFPGGRQRLTDTGAYAGMWVPWYVIPHVCRGLWPNLAAHWAFIVFAECAYKTKELLTSDNEWQVLKHDVAGPQLRIRCGSLSVTFGVLPSGAIRFRIGHLASPHDVAITTADVADLDEFFYTRVLRSPHHRDRVASFVTLLALPFKTLRDFVSLIRWEKVELAVERDRESKGEGGSNVVGEICLEKKPLPPGGTEYLLPFGREGNPAEDIRGSSPQHVEGNVYYDRRKGVVDFALGFTCPVDPNRGLWRQENRGESTAGESGEAPGGNAPTEARGKSDVTRPEKRFLLTWLRCSVRDESIELVDLQGPLDEEKKEHLSMLIRTALDLNTREESEGSKMQRAATAIQATLVSQ